MTFLNKKIICYEARRQSLHSHVAGNKGDGTRWPCPYLCSATITGFPRKEFSTGIKVDPSPKHWDKDDWRVKGKSENVVALNDRIEQVREDVKRHYLALCSRSEKV